MRPDTGSVKRQQRHGRTCGRSHIAHERRKADPCHNPLILKDGKVVVGAGFEPAKA